MITLQYISPTPNNDAYTAYLEGIDGVKSDRVWDWLLVKPSLYDNEDAGSDCL